MQNQFNKSIQRLRCDNGGEYSSAELKDFSASKGIIIEYAPPYFLQSNGITEGFNRIILDKARSTVTWSMLPNSFWGDAVLCANYLRNQSITKPLKMPLFQQWFGEPPSRDHFKICSC